MHIEQKIELDGTRITVTRSLDLSSTTSTPSTTAVAEQSLLGERRGKLNQTTSPPPESPSPSQPTPGAALPKQGLRVFVLRPGGDLEELGPGGDLEDLGPGGNLLASGLTLIFGGIHISPSSPPAATIPSHSSSAD